MSAAANLDAPVTIDGVFAQIRAVMVERDRLRDSIERAAAALGLHDAANGDPASIIAKCRRVLGAGPGETLLEACTRVAQRQPRPAPLTPERAAVLDEDTEATPRMVAAIQEQAREGETPDQTVERIIRERDGSRVRLAFCDRTLDDVCRALGLNVDETSRGDMLRKIERLTNARAEAERLRGEGDDIEAELLEVFGEHRADDSTIAKVRTLIAWHRDEVDFIGQIEPLLGLDDDPGQIPDAIRKLIEERDQARAEVDRLRSGGAVGTFAEAFDLLRPEIRDGESVVHAMRRVLAERDFAESQRQLFVRASNIDGEILDAIRAALGTPEGVDVTEHARAVAADLRRAEHDLARLISSARFDADWADTITLCNEIEERGAPGWLERALSDETAEPVRQERETWEARVSEAVQEGERRIDAVEKERKKLATRVAELRDERERLRDALTRIAAILGVADTIDPAAIIEGAANAREELDEARLLGHAPGLVIAIQTAVPAIRGGLNAGGSHAPEAVQARNEARDSLHALEAAVEGQEPPAAVLSAAERKAVEALRRWRELPDERIGDPFAAEWLDVLEAADAVIEAGRPLASEGAA